MVSWPVIWGSCPAQEEPRPLGRADEEGSTMHSGAEVHLPIRPLGVLDKGSKRKSNSHMWLVEASFLLVREL